LHNKHLVAELHEITRVFTLARNAQDKLGSKKIPSHYTLGTGHVLFFYTRLKFIANRYEKLCNEMRTRNYKVNQINSDVLLQGIKDSMINDYVPTEEAILINQQRILDRTKPNWK
jgi:hypothetical protein